MHPAIELDAARLLPVAEAAVSPDPHDPNDDRRRILTDVATLLARYHTPQAIDEVLAGVLLQLATQSRYDFLIDLGHLLPCLAGDDPATTDRLAEDVLQICRWWP